MLNIEIRGADAAARDVSRWAAGLNRDLGPAWTLIASRVVARTKTTLPRRTGALAASTNFHAEPAGATASMGSGLRYGGYAEHGGRGFPRSSIGNFLGAATTAIEPAIPGLVGQATTRSIEGFPWVRS